MVAADKAKAKKAAGEQLPAPVKAPVPTPEKQAYYDALKAQREAEKKAAAKEKEAEKKEAEEKEAEKKAPKKKAAAEKKATGKRKAGESAEKPGSKKHAGGPAPPQAVWATEIPQDSSCEKCKVKLTDVYSEQSNVNEGHILKKDPKTNKIVCRYGCGQKCRTCKQWQCSENCGPKDIRASFSIARKVRWCTISHKAANGSKHFQVLSNGEEIDWDCTTRNCKCSDSHEERLVAKYQFSGDRPQFVTVPVHNFLAEVATLIPDWEINGWHNVTQAKTTTTAGDNDYGNCTSVALQTVVQLFHGSKRMIKYVQEQEGKGNSMSVHSYNLSSAAAEEDKGRWITRNKIQMQHGEKNWVTREGSWTTAQSLNKNGKIVWDQIKYHQFLKALTACKDGSLLTVLTFNKEHRVLDQQKRECDLGDDRLTWLFRQIPANSINHVVVFAKVNGSGYIFDGNDHWIPLEQYLDKEYLLPQSVFTPFLKEDNIRERAERMRLLLSEHRKEQGGSETVEPLTKPQDSYDKISELEAELKHDDDVLAELEKAVDEEKRLAEEKRAQEVVEPMTQLYLDPNEPRGEFLDFSSLTTASTPSVTTLPMNGYDCSVLQPLHAQQPSWMVQGQGFFPHQLPSNNGQLPPLQLDGYQEYRLEPLPKHLHLNDDDIWTFEESSEPAAKSARESQEPEAKRPKGRPKGTGSCSICKQQGHYKSKCPDLTPKKKQLPQLTL